MPLKITILSGHRQGDILELDRQLVQIGEMPTDDVAFDPENDSGIQGRRAILKLEHNGWRIYSQGAKPIFVNHDLVSDVADLRSGDIVRLSLDGPDFSFDLLSNLSKKITASASVTPLASVASPASVVKRQAAESSQEKQIPGSEVVPVRFNARMFLLPIVGLFGLLLVAAIAWPIGTWLTVSKTIPSAELAPDFVPFGVLTCKEGEDVFWRPTLTNSHSGDRFQLSDDAPAAMTIDPSTGTIRWATVEEDGPGEYRCQLTVTRSVADQTLSQTKTLEIRVQEINRPPVVAAIPTQEINLRNQQDLSISLLASDPDTPHQKLSFHLRPEAPEGVSLDSQSGQLSWHVDPNLGNKEVIIPYRVTDDAVDPLYADGILRVRIISPDPWSLAEQDLRDSIYLLVAKTDPGRLIVPLGSGCAIAKRTLLTSASVASAANDAIKRGWTVLAVDTQNFELAEPKGLKVEQIQSHALYVRANSIQDPQQRGIQQAYFDLAVLTTEGEMPNTCKLGDVEASLKNDQLVACFGYEIRGGSLSRFDRLEPIFTKLKVLEVIPPPNQVAIPGREPLLLQLVGELPFQPFGSVIVNEDSEVLGIYAFRGQLPEGSSSPPVHYASESVHAQAHLKGQGLELWVEPAD